MKILAYIFFISALVLISQSWILAAVVFFIGLIILGLSVPEKQRVVLKLAGLIWYEAELSNILIIGQIGRGKTISALTNIITQFSKHYENWGGMILGVKGDEHHFIYDHFKTIGREEDVKPLQVRPEDENEDWEPPLRMNLTGDRRLPWASYASMIIDAGKALDDGGKGNSFWANTAERIFKHTFMLLDALNLPTTIPELYLTLVDPALLDSRLKECVALETNDFTMQEAVKDLETTILKAKAEGQKEGTAGTLKEYLGFFLEPDIQKVFCSSNPNVHIEDMNFGKVLATSIPQRFMRARKYIHTLIKSLGYQNGMLRYDGEARSPGFIKKCNRLLFIFDEAQELITATKTGVADHTTADRIRGAKVSLIFAMQSLYSPDTKISKDERLNLVKHFPTRICFQIDHQEAKEICADLGQNKRKKVSRGTSIGGGKGSRSRNISEEMQNRLDPSVIVGLDSHQCVIIHPSKRFAVTELAPLTPEGKVPQWFKDSSGNRRSLRRFNKYIHQQQ